MTGECGSSRTRDILDVVVFLAVVAIGAVLIVEDVARSVGLDLAAYLASVYRAWRLGATRRRSSVSGGDR